jgi:DnaJ family protein A protein 2
MSSKSLYEVLGVDKSASQEDIRKTFLKLARQNHPDKGGDEEKFKELVRANEVLSDENKRRMYDQTGVVPGEESRQPPPGPMPFSFDLNNLFGMFGGMGMNKPTRRGGKGPSQVQNIPMNLKHFYFGYNINININKQVFCKSCDGSGAKKKESCGSCRGQGVQVQIINMGGMQMHTQGPCGACNGKGTKTIEECKDCHGLGKSNEAKTLTTKILPGMKPGENIVFPEECSEQKEFEKPGDIVLIIVEEPNPNWTRSGNDLQNLETTVKLSLAESLVGCTIRIDGHPGYDEGLFIEMPAGCFTNDVYCLNGFGMPIRDKPASYGDLLIKIIVEVNPNDRKLLATRAQEALLPIFGERRRETPTDDVDIEKGIYLK